MMIGRGSGLLVMVVAGSLAWMGCQPVIPPGAQNQKGPGPAQTKASPKWVRSKLTLGDDSIRCRLLLVEAVQKDLGLTADQIARIRDQAKISEGR